MPIEQFVGTRGCSLTAVLKRRMRQTQVLPLGQVAFTALKRLSVGKQTAPTLRIVRQRVPVTSDVARKRDDEDGRRLTAIRARWRTTECVIEFRRGAGSSAAPPVNRFRSASARFCACMDCEIISMNCPLYICIPQIRTCW